MLIKEIIFYCIWSSVFLQNGKQSVFLFIKRNSLIAKGIFQVKSLYIKTSSKKLNVVFYFYFFVVTNPIINYLQLDILTCNYFIDNSFSTILFFLCLLG